jgi:hypothetical protein
MLLMLALCIGCSGVSKSSSTPTSAWAGTYTGSLNFSGCGSVTPPASCGGDSITLTVAQAYVGPEFSSSLTTTGTDSTTAQMITGTGNTLDVIPAAPRTGVGANATFTTSLSGTSFGVVASGPVPTGNNLGVVQTLLVYYCAGAVDIATGTCGGNAAYLGTLTRQQ